MPAAIATGPAGIVTLAGLDSVAGLITGVPAFLTLHGDSSITTSMDSTGSTKWVRHGSPANYEHRVTVTSGALTSGTAGSWLAGDSNHTWQANTCDFTLEVRDKWTLAVVKTVAFVLTP